MKISLPKKIVSVRLFEFSVVSMLILFFLLGIFYNLAAVIDVKPRWLDGWYMCYMLKHQVTRILGINPGGIWEGGTFYPFHKISILFDEPLWGVSLLVTPVWMFTRNIFSVYDWGGIFAIFLSWIFTYYFVKMLGGRRIWAFYAGAMFCLSGVSLILISGQYGFWVSFFIPLLGIITLKIFSTSGLRWGVLWGFLFGYLAWCSAHLFVMGGVFLGLLILWNLLYNNHSKKTLLALLIAFIISGIIAGVVLGSMYFTYKRFGLYRSYEEPYLFASNFANLIYRSWPDTSFNPITKTQLWEYLKANAKGETNIGVSFLLFFSAVAIFIIRLKESVSLPAVHRYAKYYTAGIAIIISLAFAFLNMYAIMLRCRQYEMTTPPQLAVSMTYLYYAVAGVVIYLLRNRFRSAVKHLDFFLLLSALLFGFLAFGPYYLTGNKLIVASPIAFLQYHAPGFSGIRATARWGLIFSFTLSVAVAISLSKYATSRRLKICALVFILLSFFELSPGFRIPDFKNLSPYKWGPRATDMFLKNLPDNGAVLEMTSYPVEVEQRVSSDNSLGCALFSRLYHKKPLVMGYASQDPHVSNRYLFFPEDRTFSPGTITILRKFGAKYWVFHIEGWTTEKLQALNNVSAVLKKIAELDNGKTLIYEDPDPKASVGYYDVK